MATTKYQEIEKREGRSMSEILIDLYAKYGSEPKAQEVIAKQLSISQPTLSQWIKYLRLTRKTILLRPNDIGEGGDAHPQAS